MMISVQLTLHVHQSLRDRPQSNSSHEARTNTLQTDCFCEHRAITVAALSSGLVRRPIETRSTFRRERPAKNFLFFGD